MWDMTVRSSQWLDAFHQWCLRHILRIPFTAHVTNQEVCLRSAQPPVTQTIMLRRLRFFGHIIRSDPDEDHTRALNAGINVPPKEWRWPRGRPRQTWLRTVENDLKHQNMGLCMVGPAQSLRPAWNRGNGDAPAGARKVMMMMTMMMFF